MKCVKMAMYVDDAKLILKRIIHPSKSEFKELPKNTKVTFHFKTEKLQDGESVIIDDSKKLGRPMELILGRSFKFGVWETCLKTMRVDEVAKFSVDKSLVMYYPWVSKTLRKALGKDNSNDTSSSHCCGMIALQKESLGHEDLDDLSKNLQNLDFTINILKIELPGEYAQEAWALSDTEKLNSVPGLREEGNALYKKQDYEAAASKYAEALGRLEHLILREKPGDEEWVALDKMKIPLLLNFAQCKLLLKEFYPVIEHTTTVLDRDPNNVKALYRRAKAHVGAWNPKEARHDFTRVAELDSNMGQTIKKELQNLNELQRKKNQDDAERLKGKMF